MRSVWFIGIVGCGLLAAGQSSTNRAPLAQAAQPPVQIFREIDDPSTGAHWLLERDPREPGGPGRMVLAAQAQAHGRGNQNRTEALRLLPVIRAGDRLILEENTPIVHAHLAALAVSPAQAGAPLLVRLEIGGRVLRAVALAPGRAQLVPEGSVTP